MVHEGLIHATGQPPNDDDRAVHGWVVAGPQDIKRVLVSDRPVSPSLLGHVAWLLTCMGRPEAW